MEIYLASTASRAPAAAKRLEGGGRLRLLCRRVPTKWVVGDASPRGSRSSYVPFGCHSCAAFNASGKTDCTFCCIPWKLRPPMGCGTTRRAVSDIPCCFKRSLNCSSNTEVTIVTVGMPFFSTVSWSTTSDEIQRPQPKSACAAITSAGF